MQFNKALFSNKEIVKIVANFPAISIEIHFQVIKYVPFNLLSTQDHNFITSICTAISSWFDYYREVALTWAWSVCNWNALRFVAPIFGLFVCRIVDLLPQWAIGRTVKPTHMQTGPPQMQPKCVAVVSRGVFGLGLPGTAFVLTPAGIFSWMRIMPIYRLCIVFKLASAIVMFQLPL